MKTLTKKFQIISYDCICDEVSEKGYRSYSVNDAYTSSFFINISENMTDKDILKELKNIGYMNKNCKFKSFEIVGDYDYSIYIDYITNKAFMPFCELRVVED